MIFYSLCPEASKLLRQIVPVSKTLPVPRESQFYENFMYMRRATAKALSSLAMDTMRQV